VTPAGSPTPDADAVLVLEGVRRTVDGREVLRGIDWTVRPGQHWVVLGPNGCGKTTLMRIASLWLHPSAGRVEVLGQRLGHTDVRTLRTRIGVASAAVADQLRPRLTVLDIVMTARRGALEPWWHDYDDADRDAADEALRRVDADHLAAQTFGSLSSGERQRALLARALVNDPGLVLLDEPTAALDLGGREALVATLDRLAADDDAAPMVLVTHHVEEIPTGFTHVLLLRDGAVVGAGPIDDVLDADGLSACFGLELGLERRRGRFSVWTR